MPDKKPTLAEAMDNYNEYLKKFIMAKLPRYSTYRSDSHAG